MGIRFLHSLIQPLNPKYAKVTLKYRIYNGFEESNARWSARARRANKTKVFPGGHEVSDSRAGIARAQRRKKKKNCEEKYEKILMFQKNF